MGCDRDADQPLTAAVRLGMATPAGLGGGHRINVRNAEGKMVPLRSLMEVRVVVGPPSLIRFNNLRAVTVQGSPASGVSSGQALNAMEKVAASTLPQGYAGTYRYGVPGEARRGQDRNDPRLCPAVRVPVPGRAV